MYRDYKNGLNNALNFQIQGLSASIINLAMIEMTKQFKEHGLNAYVALTVHDQCIVDSSEACSDKASKIVQTTMENSVKLDVALKAKPQFAHNMRDGH
jgi:DNA polymerase I-like protein with 3'-5' exonuclease and polymerase domains